MPKKALKLEMGTAWFLAILLISAATAFWPIDIGWNALILGICGAVVAMLNIRVDEEKDFLIGTTGLIVVLFALVGIGELAALTAVAKAFFVNLLISFAVAGFVVALSLIAKVGLRR